MGGFDNLKDFIDVVFMPSVLFVLGVWLPKRIEKLKSEQRKKEFEKLIYREMQEMEPHEPENQKEQVVWTDYLRKRFIHEEIFRNPSENRDFILSLNPDLAYHEAQLWINFDKALGTRCDNEKKKEKLTESEMTDIGEYGGQWCIHLINIVEHLEPTPGKLQEDLYAPWEKLILERHPAAADKINNAKKSLAGKKSRT